MKYLTVLLSLVFVHSLSAQTLSPPNFLFLLSDDQAWSGLSCQMHPDIPESKSAIVETPNLAKLASEGMRFSAAYSPAAVCSPSRISLQTGKSPAQCRWTKAAPSMVAEDGFKLIPPLSRKSILPEEVTIGEMLQAAGYMTAHYGKWHLGGGGPQSHGYLESDGDTGNGDAAPHVEPNPVDIYGMGERAMAFMQTSQNLMKPFFIQMSYHALHYPENASKALLEKYRNLNPQGNAKEIGRAAMAEELDRGIGLLLKKLDDLNLSRSTYVIYMSDNGSGNKALRMKGGKGDVWESGIRVPMIVRGRGILPNTWCHERVVGYDWFPTICQLAGIRQGLPEVLEGGSLAGILKGSTLPVQRPRKELVFHFPHYQGEAPHTAMFLGNHKLIRSYEDNSLHLFDISQDITESNNLAESQPVLAESMLKTMNAYLLSVQAAFPLMNPKYDPLNPPSIKATSQEKKERKVGRRPGMAGKPMKPGKGPGGKPGKGRMVDDAGGVDLSPDAFNNAASVGVGTTTISSSDPLAWLPAHQSELDVNGDGSLAMSELMNHARTSFFSFDADQNGFLSPNEYQGKTPQAGLAALLVAQSGKFDTNADTYITAVEFAQVLKDAFTELDTNQDGNLSALDSTPAQ